MKCPFLQHGLAIAYDHVVKPCCEWKYDQDYAARNHVSRIDITQWRQQMVQVQDQLSQGQWPQSCDRCRINEQLGTSLRLNGINAYQHYDHDEITLEIRPGSVCNFACQTCWPEASSRVARFYQQAGIGSGSTAVQSLRDFDFLLPMRDQIRDVVLLGGEPFYDPACREFLHWAQHNLQSRLTMFTNGSQVDWNFVDSYRGKLVLVFSLDAVGKPAEYIRFGTDWSRVLANYQRSLACDRIETRVNVTTSVFNYLYLLPLLHLLGHEWPSVVTWGEPRQEMFLSSAIQQREPMLESVSQCLSIVNSSHIEPDQRSHARTSLEGLITKITQTEYRAQVHNDLKKFVHDMDRVKHIRMRDHCPELANLLQID